MVVLLAGCGVKFGADDESSSGGDSSSGTLGNSSAPNDTSSTSTGGDGTTEVGTVDTGLAPTVTGDETSVSDGSTVTTVVMTSEGFTTGDAELSACEAMCQNALGCRLVGDANVCVGLCLEKFEGAAGSCVAAHEAMNACFSTLSCEHLELAFAGDLGHPCGSEQLDKSEACDNPVSCDSGGGGDIDGTHCELTLQCGGDPVRDMKCDAEQCLCLVDGEQVGSCAADGVCDQEFDALATKAVECCGFPLFEV